MEHGRGYDPADPVGPIAKAFAKYRDDKVIMQRFWLSMGLQQTRVLRQRQEQVAKREVSTSRPERGGKAPAEFHGKVEQLGHFAIDWLYQAQL